MERVEGQFEPGKTLKVYSKVSPGRAFPVKVTEFSPEQRMQWTGGMPLELFKGVRTFTPDSQSADSTLFTMREEYTAR